MQIKTSTEWAKALRDWAAGRGIAHLSCDAMREIAAFLEELPATPGRLVGKWSLGIEVWEAFERPQGGFAICRNSDHANPVYLADSEQDAVSYIRNSMYRYTDTHIPTGFK